MITGVARAFSDDIAIDLGTANTLVHVVGRGIIIDEPSVVAVQVRGGQREVLAVGLRAKAMYGKTPEPVEILRPMRDGVIADFVATEEMLRQFISRAKTMLGFRRPRRPPPPSRRRAARPGRGRRRPGRRPPGARRRPRFPTSRLEPLSRNIR